MIFKQCLASLFIRFVCQSPFVLYHSPCLLSSKLFCFCQCLEIRIFSLTFCFHFVHAFFLFVANQWNQRWVIHHLGKCWHQTLAHIHICTTILVVSWLPIDYIIHPLISSTFLPLIVLYSHLYLIFFIFSPFLLFSLSLSLSLSSFLSSVSSPLYYSPYLTQTFVSSLFSVSTFLSSFLFFLPFLFFSFFPINSPLSSPFLFLVISPIFNPYLYFFFPFPVFFIPFVSWFFWYPFFLFLSFLLFQFF